VLTEDDRIRRDVITQLICHFTLTPAEIERRHNIVFAEYFAAELAELSQFAADGLLEMTDDMLTVTPSGRLLIRRICMAFDQYIPKQQPTKGFSRII